MESINLKQIINDYPECITNGAKLKAILLDTYPEISKAIVNTLVIMANSGIAKEIQDSENITELDKSRWQQKLEDEGLSEKAIEVCFNLLMDKPFMKNVSISSNTIKTGDISKTIQVGQTIEFGSYWQGDDKSDGKTPIEWLVLAAKDGKSLLISKYALDCKPYNSEFDEVTWENCTLRYWLNNVFLKNAFNSNEQIKIQTTNVSADPLPIFNITAGNATVDRIFLLSVTEATKYFNDDESRKCVPTQYAKSNGRWVNGEYTKDGYPTCWWWLRTSSWSKNSATGVGFGGSVDQGGLFVHDVRARVRPSLWIDFSNCT